MEAAVLTTACSLQSIFFFLLLQEILAPDLLLETGRKIRRRFFW